MNFNFKTVVDYFWYLVSVPTCVFCNERLDFSDEALCPKCKAEYENNKKRNCSRCSKILSECTCPPYYLYTHYVKKLIKVFRYSLTEQETPWNYMLYALKQSNRADVFDFLSKELCKSIENCITLDNKEKYIITVCPRRKSAIIEYGYDHSAEIAKRVTKRLGIRYLDLFKSKSKKAQKQTHGIEDRLKNIDIRYKKKNSPDLRGYTVLLIDDIVTTGATMGYCAALLRGLGAKNIIGLSLAAAYKDIPSQTRLKNKNKKIRTFYTEKGVKLPNFKK